MGSTKMSVVPSTPPPPDLPRASFTGGVRQRPLGFGVSAPFGHLEFDASDLHIWGGGADLRVRRDEVKGIRIGMGILASRVSAVMADGAESQVFFAALGRRGVRTALIERGWPIIERRSRRTDAA